MYRQQRRERNAVILLIIFSIGIVSYMLAYGFYSP
jgi:hypothetical protein